jgi:hypothetical protein
MRVNLRTEAIPLSSEDEQRRATAYSEYLSRPYGLKNAS